MHIHTHNILQSRELDVLIAIEVLIHLMCICRKSNNASEKVVKKPRKDVLNGGSGKQMKLSQMFRK